MNKIKIPIRSIEKSRPRMTTTDKRILELARQSNVKPITDFNSLLGDFWPEDESADDFIAAVRSWRREGLKKQ